MPARHSNRFLWLAILGAGLVTVVFIYMYVGQPLPEPWNTNVVNLIVSLAAIGGAVVATLNWRSFSPADRGPRHVWGNLALALWLWAVGETLSLGYSLLGVEQPLLSLSDVFWLVAYVFFAIALIHQYHLVYRSSRRREFGLTVGVVAGCLIISIVITALLQSSATVERTWFETLVTVLYPFLDLAVGVAAAWLVYAFGGGLWSRPWIGLFVFAVADGLYAWLNLTGLYQTSLAAGGPLSLIADTVYMAAYLVIALACFSTWLLLRLGLQRTVTPDAGSLPH